mmetsp:Transcript_41648/g.67551  ORF Transcript_41648/g.67551 Transcript_41648/m.67551 type:complete len:93 (-) Transcript_41648:1363-1641(-)
MLIDSENDVWAVECMGRGGRLPTKTTWSDYDAAGKSVHYKKYKKNTPKGEVSNTRVSKPARGKNGSHYERTDCIQGQSENLEKELHSVVLSN